MDFLINIGAKMNGLTATVMDLLPLLGAAGSILGVGAAILTRAAASQDPAGLFHALHPTGDEYAAVALGVAVIRAHFLHAQNAAKIEDHAAAIAAAPTPDTQAK